jgi:hypothetical protein
VIATNLRSIPLLTSLTGLVVLTPAYSQTYLHPDSAVVARAAEAGARLVHWVETTNGQEEQAVFLRNTSREPIQITSYEIFDCANLRGSVCGRHAPGPRIEPGKTVRLVVISRSFSQSRWFYKYRFNAVFVRDSLAADTAHH